MVSYDLWSCSILASGNKLFGSCGTSKDCSLSSIQVILAPALNVFFTPKRWSVLYWTFQIYIPLELGVALSSPKCKLEPPWPHWHSSSINFGWSRGSLDCPFSLLWPRNSLRPLSWEITGFYCSPFLQDLCPVSCSLYDFLQPLFWKSPKFF